MYIYEYVHIHKKKHIQIFMCVYTHIYLYTYMHICIIFIYIHRYIHVFYTDGSIPIVLRPAACVHVHLRVHVRVLVRICIRVFCLYLRLRVCRGCHDTVPKKKKYTKKTEIVQNAPKPHTTHVGHTAE